jgi:pimeloyl-ACP methyl ester carboxylesterase
MNTAFNIAIKMFVHTIKILRPLLSFAAVLSAGPGPNAGEVLQSFVTYRAFIASRPGLAPAQKSELEHLDQLASAAEKTGDYRNALRHITHGMAILQGMEWTPATSLSLSLQVTLDHIMWEPGKTVHVTVSEKFPHEGEFPEKLPVQAFLKSQEPGELYAPVKKWDPIDLQKLPWTGEFQVPAIKNENFYGFELKFPTTAPVMLQGEVTIRLQSGVEGRAEAIRQRAEKLNAEAKTDTAFLTVLYAANLYHLVDSSSVDSKYVNFRKEFDSANRMLDALEQGTDPVRQGHGDMHLAYRSKLDGTLQPYRLFIPSTYDSKKDVPLVVVLHGMGGDENTIFEAYRSTALQQLAEHFGYLIVCPKGRETTSMYRGAAEQDVMDVLAEVRRQFRVDGKRIYLMGHSMGGYGTWSIAMNHPDVFAALAPVSGGGDPAGLEKIRSIPEFVVHGSADTIVPVKNSQIMVDAAKKLGIEVQYKEIAGGDHSGVLLPIVGEIFAWFQTHPKN